VIVECATHPRFLSNTYLVAERAGGPAFFVDAGGPVQGLIDAARRLELKPTHVLLTHHHFDHACEVAELRKRWPELDVRASGVERELAGEAQDGEAGGAASGWGTLEAGEALRVGALEVNPLHTPGHTAGMLSFLVSASPAAVFTGDTLFKSSVGGVKAPGHTTYGDLRDSIMGTLMELPGETVIYPGHAAATTVAQEWEGNPFIRTWRGLDPEGTEPCVALGRPATLVLLARDYDGGTKAWVRWPDGSDDIVPGSRLERKA
jgi:hydroxyacylglutathione hydrolase